MSKLSQYLIRASSVILLLCGFAGAGFQSAVAQASDNAANTEPRVPSTSGLRGDLRGPYLRVSFAQTSFDDDDAYNGYDLDDSDTGYRLDVGYRISRHCGIELGYADLGQYKIRVSPLSEATQEFSAISLTGHGIVPFGNSGIEFFGHAGLARISVDTKVEGSRSFLEDLDDRAVTLFMGIGFRYTPKRFGKISIELGYDSYLFELNIETPSRDYEFDQDVHYSYLAGKYRF